MEMKKPWMLLLVAVGALTVLIAPISASESPEYRVIHVEPEFEVRLYKESVWMSSPVNTDIKSFHLATKFGFHRLFQYIQGANLNWTRIPMTKPVLTSVIPEAEAGNSNSPASYVVHFFLPSVFQGSPPVPLDELQLKPVTLPSHCVAVRKFSGFARDGNIAREAEKLATSLSRSKWVNSTSIEDGNGYAYSIAQYDSPFRIYQRLNEVWVDIAGSNLGVCAGLIGVATY